MQEIYQLLQKAAMLVLASPVYYHGLSGQLKIDFILLHSLNIFCSDHLFGGENS